MNSDQVQLDTTLETALDPTPKRRRRTKEEIAADNAAKETRREAKMKAKEDKVLQKKSEAAFSFLDACRNGDK